MKISQSLLAEKLSVSVGTVSKSLRNDAAIHPQTRAQVIELASRLGYRLPSTRAGKAPAAGRSEAVKSVCLMLQSDTELGGASLQNASAVMAGISEAGHAAGAIVSIHYVPLRHLELVGEPEYQPVALREGMLSGLILHHYYPPHIIEALRQLVPIVAISRSSTHDPIDGVDCDAPHAMSLIVDHLVDRGYRRIGFLSEPAHHAWHQDRFGGFVQAMVAAGLPFDPSIAQGARNDGDEDIDRIAQATRDGVTAWVVGSDCTGYAWCRRLESRGLRVGRDFAMVGVDAYAPPAGLPRMTSIKLPFDAMGRGAVTLLMERIKEPAMPLRRLFLQGRLIEGETTPPAARLASRN